jgi:S-adenosylmethionine hydrolase
MFKGRKFNFNKFMIKSILDSKFLKLFSRNKDIKKVILITDCTDVAYNEMKMIILRECRKFGINKVDIELVPVSEFSIINASFLIRLMGENCLPGTIFSVVINPQKHRSARVYGKTKNGILFFGANTGALSWLINDFGVEDLYEVHDPGFISFGGKYVHAPNVANLLAEVPFKKFGKKFDINNITKLNIVNGTIVHIDNFGLMKIMGETPNSEDGTRFRVFVNGIYKLDATFSNRMMNRDDKEWVLYKGSSLHGMPELGTVRYKKGFEDMEFKIGDVVTWEVIK